MNPMKLKTRKCKRCSKTKLLNEARAAEFVGKPFHCFKCEQFILGNKFEKDHNLRVQRLRGDDYDNALVRAGDAAPFRNRTTIPMSGKLPVSAVVRYPHRHPKDQND